MNDKKGLAPVIVGPLGGDTVFLVGDTYTTLLSGAETGGTFTLLEALVPPDTGPPPHHHNAEDETFIMLDGEVSFRIQPASSLNPVSAFTRILFVMPLSGPVSA